MANKYMIVLFNLADDQNEEDFTAWMKANDIPVASGLPSVLEYNLVKTVGMMGGDGDPPYSHMEIIRVSDFEALGKDAEGEAIQKVGAQFQSKVKDAVWLFVDQVG